MPDIALGENSFAKDWTQRYQDAKAKRMPLEADWRKVAELGLARHYSGWVTTNASPTTAGTGAARQARISTYDSTLARSLPIYAAVMERVLTPGTQMYHTLGPENTEVRISRAAKIGFERLNNALFSRRYQPLARYAVAQGEVYLSGGAYGNAGKLITWRKPNKQLGTKGGFLYRCIPFRNLFWEVDNEEQIRTKYRRIDWTPRQAFLELGDRCPKKLMEAAKGSATSADNNRTYEFFQCISPSEDYDENALDYRRHPLGSYYIFVDEPCVVQAPSGYSSDPLVISRSATEGGQPYGYGAAQGVLSTVGLVNAQKKTWIRQGQIALSPPLLTRDDGVMNGGVDLTPGAQNPGGVNAQGQQLVHPLVLGTNLQIAEKLLMVEQDDIKAALFGHIYEMLKDQPQRTATEVLDQVAREAAQIAPTMGRYQAEDLGPQIDREIDLLAQNNALPEGLPSEMAGMDYKPTYTSPLAKSQHSESVSGFMRIAEMAMNIAKMTGNDKPVRRLDFDKAIPAIAEQQNVPTSWIKTDAQMAADDAEVKQQQARQQTLDALPGMASIAKTAADNRLKSGGDAATAPPTP